MALALAACGGAPAAPPSATGVSSADLARAREGVERARAWARARPAVEEVHVTVREAALGRAFDARGALALAPGRAARLVLLGPGGTTVLDAWITRTRWRLVVPPLGLARRGECRPVGPCDAPAPVGFFRAFFLAPFEGRVVAAVRDGRALLLGPDGAALVDARVPGAFALERLATGETVEIDAAGARVRYVRAAPAVEVIVERERAGEEPPDPDAFEDPDGRAFR